MRILNKRNLLIFKALSIAALLPVIADAANLSDPLGEITAEGQSFVDWLFNQAGRVLAGIIFFGYIVSFLITKNFNIKELMIYITCILALSLGNGFIVGFFG